MRLDQELVRRKLCESRTEAQEMIAGGFVFLNNTICTKQIRQVSESDNIEVTSRRKFVSRGGDKLEGILLDVYGSDSQIREVCGEGTVLDIGSSTGGFTDCLLFYGVSHVDAVDVGTSQLHDKIRSDVRVSVFENTDIRTFTSSALYNIVVADVSFISLSGILDDALRFGSRGSLYFLLIKPQFEVGKGNTKKGVVKDSALTNGVLETYMELAKEKGLSDIRITPCVISGGDGNQEYFLYGILR